MRVKQLPQAGVAGAGFPPPARAAEVERLAQVDAGAFRLSLVACRSSLPWLPNQLAMPTAPCSQRSIEVLVRFS
jgi:hypothetical protein